MIRTSLIALASLLLCLPSGAQAQGFLDKMKEKAGASLGLKNTSTKPTKSQLKAAETDSLDTFLDQKAAGIAKDNYAINGIWYSTKPIRLRNDLGETGLIGKKFLLEFDEATYRLTFKTRYAYEATNRSKLVRPGLWLSESVPPKVSFAQAVREGHFALLSYGSDNANYLYATYTGQTDLQGKVSRGHSSTLRLMAWSNWKRGSSSL